MSDNSLEIFWDEMGRNKKNYFPMLIPNKKDYVFNG